MTTIKQPSYALLLLSDGEYRTVVQFAEMANIAKRKAAADLSNLKGRGLLSSIDVTPRSYAITPEGVAHLRRGEADTKTSRIFEAFISGEPLTAGQVESITGIERKRVLNVAKRLEIRGLLEAKREWRNVRWQITDAGRAVLDDRDAEPEFLDAAATIETAKRSRPALEMVWGAML